MTTLDTLLEAPPLERLHLVAGPAAGHDIARACVCEKLGEIGGISAGTLVILTAAASEIEDYQLDLALREAGSAGVAGVVLYRPGDDPVHASAHRIAERSAVALLRAPLDLDCGSLCVAVEREIEQGAAASISRLKRLHSELEARGLDSDPPVVTQRIMQCEVQLDDAEPASDPIALDTVVVQGRSIAVVSVAGEMGWLAAAMCASATSRVRDAAERTQEGPLRWRSEAVTELLLASRDVPERVRDRARALGIPIDGWHVVARIEIDDYTPLSGGDAVAEHELRDEITRLALQAARAHGDGTWNAAGVQSTVVIARTSRTEPRTRSADTVSVMRDVVARLRSRYERLAFYCGVGDVHEGVAGLQSSAAEAGAAVGTARASGRLNDVVGFDAVGLRRMVLGWSASDHASRAIDELLAPLDALGARRADTAIRTLAAYLAVQGSLLKAGEQLNLHRNAVAYRIRRIAELIDLDLADPDQRFALELACRARLMTGSGEAGRRALQRLDLRPASPRSNPSSPEQ